MKIPALIYHPYSLTPDGIKGVSLSKTNWPLMNFSAQVSAELNQDLTFLIQFSKIYNQYLAKNSEYRTKLGSAGITKLIGQIAYYNKSLENPTAQLKVLGHTENIIEIHKSNNELIDLRTKRFEITIDENSSELEIKLVGVTPKVVLYPPLSLHVLQVYN